MFAARYIWRWLGSDLHRTNHSQLSKLLAATCATLPDLRDGLALHCPKGIQHQLPAAQPLPAQQHSHLHGCRDRKVTDPCASIAADTELKIESTAQRMSCSNQVTYTSLVPLTLAA